MFKVVVEAALQQQWDMTSHARRKNDEIPPILCLHVIRLAREYFRSHFIHFTPGLYILLFIYKCCRYLLIVNNSFHSVSLYLLFTWFER